MEEVGSAVSRRKEILLCDSSPALSMYPMYRDSKASDIKNFWYYLLTLDNSSYIARFSFPDNYSSCKKTLKFTHFVPRDFSLYKVRSERGYLLRFHRPLQIKLGNTL